MEGDEREGAKEEDSLMKDEVREVVSFCNSIIVQMLLLHKKLLCDNMHFSPAIRVSDFMHTPPAKLREAIKSQLTTAKTQDTDSWKREEIYNR